MFIGRTDAETEIPIFWPPDEKNWFIWKDPDAEKNWRQEKGTTEDEMASLTRWTWVWASSRSWWWTRMSGMLQSMGSQGVRHNLLTEQFKDNINISIILEKRNGQIWLSKNVIGLQNKWLLNVENQQGTEIKYLHVLFKGLTSRIKYHYKSI